MEDITISLQASEQIKKQLSVQNIPDAYLRMGLKSGGCSDFKYVLKYEGQAKETDQHFLSNDIKIIVDPKSFIYLKGSTLNWENSIMKQGFFFTNPNEKSSCGCGKSFNA
jgi:iron-sulfur cluster assembly protein